MILIPTITSANIINKLNETGKFNKLNETLTKSGLNKNLEGILNSSDLEIVEEKSIGRDLKLVIRKKNAS